MRLYVDKFRERRLKVFAFNPTQGRSFGNHITLRIPYEPLEAGPTGRYIAVVDNDETHKRTYAGVQLDDPALLRSGGLEPTELDLRFHQQMVYAVGQLMVNRFEHALGRPVRWAWAGRNSSDPLHDRLKIHPHAEAMANAYYDAENGALRFGYFKASDKAAGSNLPGQIVYSCLEFDVIAHEICHPLLDSVRPNYTSNYTNATAGDTSAFLEAFCDLMAILEHFHFDEAVMETLSRTGGLLHQRQLGADVRSGVAKAEISAEIGATNPLLGVARQLGEALGLGDALRNVLNTPPGEMTLDTVTEPHERGAVLMAAIMDAFFTIYNRRTRRLYQISGRRLGDDLPRELLLRLASEASKTARHFSQMCIRALDYCPPDSLSFGDYLRAIVTSDLDLVPDDVYGYRNALIDAFRRRGIRPEGVSSYSEEALRWPDGQGAIEGLSFAPNATTANRKAIEQYVRRTLRIRSEIKVKTEFRRSQRVGPQGQLLREMVVQIFPNSKSQKGKARLAIALIVDDQCRVRYRISRNKPAKGEPDPAALTARAIETSRERPLQIFAFDPVLGATSANRLTVRLPYEDLQQGPVGGKVAVIDYDATNDAYYHSVDLDDPEILLNGGLNPSELDPRFHQQMVYAVVSETIRRFEFALGRPVNWRWARKNKTNPLRNCLRVFPHAMQAANAFYDRDLGALLFGYFSASELEPGANLPRQTVYTCLSHDVVVHETAHAVLDSVQSFFLEGSSPDPAAFHEALGDIIALLQHFSFREALLETIRRTGGRIHSIELDPLAGRREGQAAIGAELTESNPIVELARQFGHATGMRTSLRSALGTRPGEHKLAEVDEPHDRGAILVAAIFDAFFSAYTTRTADVMRLGRAGGTVSPRGELHPDLADFLAQEAAKTARHFETLCIRALDYCPPVDIEFGDFLRAIITSDSLLAPEDRFCYRQALIAAFHSRGIWPKNARSMSEEGLRWEAPQMDLNCKGLVMDLRTPEAMKRNAVLLNAFAKANAQALGLSPSEPIQPHRFHSATQRVDPRGVIHKEFVVQLTQQRETDVFPGEADSPKMTFRGGVTMILDEEGTVRYLIGKSIDNEDRLRQNREFLIESASAAPGAAFTGRWDPTIRLAALHRGY